MTATLDGAPSITVTIPTRNDEPEKVRLAHVLQSLLLQDMDDFAIVIRDEGSSSAIDRREVRQFMDLLSRRGISVEYRRIGVPTGIAEARRDLAGYATSSPYLCFVDDDMCLAPDALSWLLATATAEPEVGFVQGTKIEADGNRVYWEDINQLNGREQPDEPVRLWFGDSALLLIRTAATDAVDWDVVTRYRLEGLTGEDVAISIMIADRYPCLGEPRAVGYHLSPPSFRWRWEPPSDLLQLELLRPLVRAETLQRAMPHLAEYL